MLVQIFLMNPAYGEVYEVMVTGIDTAKFYVDILDLMEFLKDYQDCTIYTAL